MKLYILRYEILDLESKVNLKLEEKIKKALASTYKLFDQKVYNEDGKTIKYEFAGGSHKEDNLSRYKLRKGGEANISKVEMDTGNMSKKKIPNDDLARFVIYFRENLIFFQYFGHFGVEQFKETLEKMIYDALDEENIERNYIFNINTLNCQPIEWKLESLEKHLKDLKIIKKLNLNVKIYEKKGEKLKLLRTEGYNISDKIGVTLTDSLISNILNIKKHYLEISKENDIYFSCEDTEGHPFTINIDKRHLNFEIKDIPDDRDDIFLEKVRNAYDEYLNLYC